MKNQKGFTLIELVVVIIILGILAVTAAPKFINLQSDARESTLDGMKGALQGANTLLYSKAAIQGKEKADGGTTANIDIDNDGTDDVIGVYGYVKADAAQVSEILDIDTNEWTVVANSDTDVSAAPILLHPKDITISKDKKCFVEYTGATSSSDLPDYAVVADDC
ncbi:type II secretion system protein [Shewanella nanhaiensis]|uniref:Type II secretion system GspH family protein n=1 Tax=Shewanella nanhaiensis TaxID=2864872 RepID=A0ABS7DZN3_9GAMM|nr:type II secretion system protein [Shewanella nanhaiensis]MBW8182824.1 type II secretion system GspH family protein [Shewanella nanhaiensis]